MTTTTTTINTSEETPLIPEGPLLKEPKKRAPKRSKEEIAAAKEAAAMKKSEREAKKAAAAAAKAAKTAKKEERQAKKDAKPKMMDAEGNEIKKNQTAYFLFQAAKRDEVTSELQASNVEEGVKVSLGSVAKKIGELWKACTEEEKSEFVAAAAEDKLRYDTAVEANPENAFNMEAAKKANVEAKKAKTAAKKAKAVEVKVEVK